MLLGAWPLGGKNSSASSHSGKLKFVILCFGYTLFLVIGAAIFSAIEGPKIELLSQKVRDLRMKFLQKNACVDDDELESFIRDITQANEKGISTLRNASNELNWSFGQAIFFSTTIITTIGYGHVTPLSSAGKLFCMIYATIGIPLTLILLNAAVYRLLRPIEWLLGVLNSKLGHLYQPFNIRFLHLSIIMTAFILIFLTIPTFIFTYLEPSWEFLDAFYYCFISLTTIGLGDYIPGDDLNQDNRSIYKIGTTCYLILGLTAMMLTVTVFYDIPQLNVGQLFTDMDSDETEKLRLSGSGAPCYSGPSGLYIPQRNEEVRSVVRIRPRADDSPSPDDPTPMHARDIRVP